MQFDLTVITPVLNDETYIARTIESVLSQKGVRVEYIVVDGMSTDRTGEIIEQYLEYGIKYISEPGTGLYVAINKGIKAATSDRIVVLNSGDYYNSDHSLELLLECSRRENDSKIIYGKMLTQNEDGSDPDLRSLARVGKALLLKGCDIPHPTTLIPRQIYEKHGLYDCTYCIMSDYDLLLRMHRSGVLFKGINETIVIFQRGGLSSNFFKNLPESYLIRKNNGIPPVVNLLFTFRSVLISLISELLIKTKQNYVRALLLKCRRYLDL